MYRKLVVAGVLAAGCVGLLFGASLVAGGEKDAGAGEALVLVELFTSEGCSSCPPADRLLADLLAKQPVAGATIVPMAFHVDYWDQLGWKDPFGDPAYSKRQRAYASLLKSDSVYTPQMIVNGTTGFVGGDFGAALKAIKNAAAHRPIPIFAAVVSQTDEQLSLQLDVGAVSATDGVLWAAIVEDGLSSEVTRGENTGRTLPHDAVVRVMKGSPHTPAAGGQDKATLDLPWNASWKRDRCRVVVAIQGTGSGAVYALGQLALTP